MTKEVLMLGLLKRLGPICGHELHKQSKENLMGYPGLSRGTVYRCLGILAKKKLIEEVRREPGRSKERVLYAVTESGGSELMYRLQNIDVGIDRPRGQSLNHLQFYTFLSFIETGGDLYRHTAVRKMKERALSVQHVMEKTAAIKTPGWNLETYRWFGMSIDLSALQMAMKQMEAAMHQKEAELGYHD